MRLPPFFTVGDHQGLLLDCPQPLDVNALLQGGPWELEIGYGKGKFLLQEALAHPERRFLGIEVVSKYQKLLSKRARHWGAGNLVNVRGEAHYVLASILPKGFVDRLHVYFPDPWPKARHHRRRLFDPETVDLVLGALRPGGELCFATDFLDYGELVMELLEGYPGLKVEPILEPWPDGARTNYEAKYMEEGRPIIRCRARLSEHAALGALHPGGAKGIVSAWHRREE